MRFALGLEYDGNSFCGWQSQPNGGGVQDAVERALSIVASTPIRVHCAGRTDAGVHAAVQVVHFDTAVVRPHTAWVRGTNAHLPDAVGIRWVRAVPDTFHARFSATGRCYRYILLNRPVRPALLAGRVGWHHLPLDVDAMQAGAACLLGEHDFSSFRAAQCQAASPVRRVSQATVRRQGDYVVFDFAANAFLHHMVRNMVGALVYVGKGAQAPAWITHLLDLRDRTVAAPTFSPSGLYLAGVDYPDDADLPDGGRIRAEVMEGLWA